MEDFKFSCLSSQVLGTCATMPNHSLFPNHVLHILTGQTYSCPHGILGRSKSDYLENREDLKEVPGSENLCLCCLIQESILKRGQ